MTLKEAQEAASAPVEELDWDQVNSFARWATLQGLQVEELPEDDHMLVIHEDHHSEAA